MHVDDDDDDDDDDVGKDENYDQDVDLFQRMRKQYRSLGSIGHTRPSSSRALGYHDRLLVAYKSGALGLTPTTATPHYTHRCVQMRET